MFQTLQIDTVKLLFINIPEFVTNNFPSLAPGFRTSGPHYFPADEPALSIFTENEITTINNFKAMKKQIEWICGRICVKKLISTTCETDAIRVTVCYEPDGAPLLESDHNISFSISHSGNFAGCALNAINSAVGLDIEKMEPINSSTINHILSVSFSDRERKQALNSSEIYTTWTMKEAYLKYIRRGFHETIKDVEYLNDTLYYRGSPLDLRKQSIALDNEHLFSLIW
ncbi:MAG: 4'-phosphopantetheinyl transferase superfamily protein [Spirochaetes bacterium]|jgi:4'-phosphopantetheinyl transferase|nr:4'-phosphopantetheinyl transferase superfamily protein [Spirochaetota bacterium]